MRFADFARTYGNGGWYADFRPPLISEPAGRWIGSLFPAYRYDRPAPFATIGEGPLSALYAQYDTMYRDGASSDVYEFENVVLYDRTLYAHGTEGWEPLYETHREQEREFKRVPFSPEFLASAKHASNPLKHYFYVGTVGSENYAHWLVDDLPRIAALSALPKETTILIDGYFPAIDRARLDSIRAMMPDSAVGIIDKTSCFFFERLYYATPPSYHPFLKSPDAIATVATLAIRDTTAPRRLFVRRSALWRNMTDEAAVVDALTPLGFTPVSLENVPFAEQVLLFSNAQLVVGVAGAAMGNTIFSPPDIPVIYLAGEGFTDPFYWDLAAVKRQRYAVCTGAVEYPERPTFSPFELGSARIRELKELIAAVL